MKIVSHLFFPFLWTFLLLSFEGDYYWLLDILNHILKYILGDLRRGTCKYLAIQRVGWVEFSINLEGGSGGS